MMMVFPGAIKELKIHSTKAGKKLKAWDLPLQAKDL